MSIAIATYATLDLFLQHPDKTYATYIWNVWNTRLQHVLIYLLPQWRLVDAELDTGADLEVTHGEQVDGSRLRWEAQVG
jgi:hypothetical protein